MSRLVLTLVLLPPAAGWARGDDPHALRARAALALAAASLPASAYAAPAGEPEEEDEGWRWDEVRRVWWRPLPPYRGGYAAPPADAPPPARFLGGPFGGFGGGFPGGGFGGGMRCGPGG